METPLSTFADQLPSAEEEVWRYSRIGDLDLAAWSVAPGSPTSVELPEDAAALGIVARSADAEGDGPDVFAAMNARFATEPVVITIPRGVTVEGPIVVRHTLTTEHAGTAVFPRLVIDVGENASATVIELVTSPAGTKVLSIPFTDARVARAGRLDLAVVQELGDAAWQIGSLVADVAQEGNLRVGLVGLGGEYARLRTDCRLSGRGAHGDLFAAYFGDGDQTLDFRTFQHHDAPDTTSNLLFKGAVGGRSRSVYTGLIRVEKEARGTNAFQTNRNIKLSDHAWAESVPNLEIETNDVKCSHASTVGPVDPEQRFYLESRGVPPQTADRLIVAGFFDEVVRDLPDVGVAAEVTSRIAAKLDRVVEALS